MDGGQYVVLGGIDGELSAKFARISKFGIVYIGSDDRRPLASRGRDDANADGATTDHQHGVNFGYPASIGRVIPDAQGFDQGQFLERQDLIGEDLGVVDRDTAGQNPVPLHAIGLVELAAVGTTDAAGRAQAAVRIRRDHHPIPFVDRIWHLIPFGEDDTAHFVARNAWERDQWHQATIRI